MTRLLASLWIVLTLASCAPLQSFLAPAAPTAGTPLLTPTLSATQAVDTSTIEATSTDTPAATNTSLPQLFILQFTAVPSDTPLPTLELPTLVVGRSLQIWDGLPTYPAESNPNDDFRVLYDPIVWALTADQFGTPVLGNRQVSNCILAPAHPHGLALNGTVDHAIRKIGGISYDINTAYVNGVKQFVSYTGGDGNIYTAFQVSFQDQADACTLDAETILATLTSVSVSQATPPATP